MSFPKYPKYKASGVEWLGDVPEHWEVWKLAHAFQIIGSGTTPKSDNSDYYEEGTIPWINTGDLNDSELEDCAKRITERAMADHSSLKLYPAGSLLIAMYGATIGKLAMLQFPATVNQACCVFGGSSRIVAKFMFYWFLGLRQQILSLATGGGQPNVSQDILRTLRIACADTAEQTAIANFLDSETARIDALIAEQRRLIELLKEKRQAVISHAVTKGLNPNAPMKPSGIDWLGDVPEHWEVLSLRRVSLSVQTGGTPLSVLLADEADAGQVWYTPGDFGDTLRLTTSARMLSRDVVASGNAKVFPPRTVLVVSIGATLGKVGFAEGVSAANQQINAVIPNEKIDGYFCAYSLSAKVEVMRFLSNASTIGIMNQEKTKDICLAIPSMSEQVEITAHLDHATETLDALTAEATRAIDLLHERRTALISAAVTGKIDVRQFANVEAA